MDGYQIALVIVAILLLIASGYIKKLVGQMKELVDVVSQALEDDEITKEELAQIIKEAKDVKDVVVEIAQLLISKAHSR